MNKRRALGFLAFTAACALGAGTFLGKLSASDERDSRHFRFRRNTLVLSRSVYVGDASEFEGQPWSMSVLNAARCNTTDLDGCSGAPISVTRQAGQFALTADHQPWWEGLTTGKPVLDWQGRPYDPARGPAAHPNSRFTVAAKGNPSYSARMEDPEGVPITAIVFGGRRREVAPLVYESRDWQHGVLVGASLASDDAIAG